MTPFPVLVDLGLVVIGAALAGLGGRRLGLPPILSYMVAGLALGPATGLLAPGASLELFSELGIALLLFLVGLELSLERIRDVGPTAAVAGLLQVAITAALGAGLALLLGIDGADAVLVGLGVAFSSTVVVIKLLERGGDLTALHGRLAVGILLVQDVVVAVVLTVLGGLADSGFGVDAVLRGMGGAATGIAVLAVAAAAGVRLVLPRLMAWLADTGEALFVVSLTWCFLFILLAEHFHVSVELGAFVAGVGLAQLPWCEELRRRVHPLVDLFLAVFFVSLAAGVELDAIGRLWPAALALSAFAVLVKPVVVALLLRGSRGARAAFLAGLTLGQISEFALVLGALATGAGIAGPDLLPLLGLVALVTIAVSAVLVPRGPSLWERISGETSRAAPASTSPGAAGTAGMPPDGGPPPAPERGHVVVVGMNTLGRDLVHRFAERGEHVVAVDTDPAKLAGLPAETIFGTADSPSVLRRARTGEALLVVSALQIQDVNALLAWRMTRTGVPVSIHAFDPSLADELLEIGADHLMISKLDGIAGMEAELRRLGAFG